MTSKDESTGGPGDAVFAALYFAAEQNLLPHEPPYDAGKGLRRFRAWLDDHAALATEAGRNQALPGDDLELPSRLEELPD